MSDNCLMSRVTDVIVCATIEEPAMEPLTRRDVSRDWHGAFALITGPDADRYWVQAGKGPGCDVWVGTFNHLNRPALLADLERLPWSCPHAVQVLLREEEDDCFGLWTFIDGRLREVPLPLTRRDPRTGMLTRTDCPNNDLEQPGLCGQDDDAGQSLVA